MNRRLYIVVRIFCIAAFFSVATGVRAHPMWGIAVDRSGQVYFSDLKTVWRIDVRGKLSAFRPRGDGHVHELNVDEQGNVYGAENIYEPATKRFISAIWKMTPEGDSSYLVAPTDNPPKGTSIWKDRGGNSYLITRFPGESLLVLKKPANGNVVPLMGSDKALRDFRQGVPHGVGGVAIGPDGAIYFVNRADVNRLEPNGRVKPLILNIAVENSPGNPPTSLYGIALDAQGNPVVADYGNRRVFRIEPDGRIATLLRAEEQWFPTGVAVRGNDFYILEYGHTPTHQSLGTRVRKISADGKITTLAVVGESGATSDAPSNEGNRTADAREIATSRQSILLAAFAALAVFASPIVVLYIRHRMNPGRYRAT
jgi:hypothetical protein